MQYTSNYNLMLPEGTDTVNLLTQMNPNTSDIDAALFANKQAVVGRATELTAGTVHAITRNNQDSPVFAFTATSNWTAGDTMSVDGTACSVYLPDGTTPAGGAYVINSEVLAIIQGSRVTLFAPAASATTASDVSYDNTGSGLTATDVQDAIDEVNANIANVYTHSLLASLTADGSTTYESIFNQLYNAIDKTKLTPTSTMMQDDAVYHITNKGNSELRYTMCQVIGTNQLIYSAIMKTSSSVRKGSVNGSVSDSSTETPVVGTIFNVYA